jgi:DNA-binding NarL/FixJ family response regulator
MARATVLIVDDHAGFRSVARDLLVSLAYDVVGEAGDGRAAVELCRRLQPQLVVLDVRLPDLDGFEVARRLLATADPPVVVLVSTREASDFGVRLAASGTAGFITKSKLSGDTLRAVLGQRSWEQA